MFNHLLFEEDQSREDFAKILFRLHPAQIAALMELFWDFRMHAPDLPEHIINSFKDLGIDLNSIGILGSPFRRSDLGGFREFVKPERYVTQNTMASPKQYWAGLYWDHLIYAYMIENTRIFDIFRQVVREFLHGEKFGVPTAPAQHWLRSTEALFYAPPLPMSVSAIETHIRPDMGASRRNAYYRMFGMDLNHGTEDNQPYRYVRADAANNEFVSTFEELLREVWVAITNWRNIVGTNPTDQGKIAELTDKIHDMLITRRENGNLSREEFVQVTWMSWFHLSLLYDSPIVVALRAEAGSEEQRLFKIASRVGLPAHGLSRSYFKLAEPLSRILILIETDAVKRDTVDIFYKPAPPSTPSVTNQAFEDMQQIITHWSIITGRDIKAGKVAPS